MRLLLLIFSLCSFSLSLATDKKGDSVVVNDLHYFTDFEKKHLEEFRLTQKADNLALLLSISETATDFDLNNIRKSLEVMQSEMEQKVRRENDMNKKVRFVFKKVHEKQFKQYELTAFFDNIFKSGAYNCVTGTALYSLLFEHYNIPFRIIEKPQHVYLIADPADKKIVVESTDPAKGYYTLTEKFKKSYVDYLIEAKMVTKESLNAEGYEALFEKNYYPAESISLRQLAGLQYYNSCVQYLAEENYLKAFYQIEKSCLLYPSQRTLYMLSVCALASLDGKDYSTPDQVDLFIKAYNYVKPDKPDDFVTEFKRMTHTFLIDKNRKDYYNELYGKIALGIKDSAFLHEVKRIYHNEMGRAYYLEGKYDKAMEQTILSLSMNSENLEVKARLSELIFEQIKLENDYNVVLTRMDEYVATYPFLKNNESVNQLYGACYLLMAASYFEANNETEGNKYLKLFEELSNSSNYSMNDKLIGICYSEAWACYVRKSQRSLAKQYLLRGLKYAPYNQDLQHKKRITEEDGH